MLFFCATRSVELQLDGVEHEGTAVSPSQPLPGPPLHRCRSRRCRCLPRLRPRPVARRLLCVASSPCVCPAQNARQKPQSRRLQISDKARACEHAFFFARLSRFRSVLRSAASSRCCCFSCKRACPAREQKKRMQLQRFLPCLKRALCFCLERLLVHALQPELLSSPCLRGARERVRRAKRLSTLALRRSRACSHSGGCTHHAILVEISRTRARSAARVVRIESQCWHSRHEEACGNASVLRACRRRSICASARALE